jgi:transcriptional regulator with XRE-family HTH domain
MDALKRQTGSRIKELRSRLGYTQKQMAHALKLSDGAISSFEQGDSLPSIKTAINIARLADVSIDWLFTGAVMENRSPEDVEMTGEEVRLLIAFRRLSKARRKFSLEILETLSQQRDKIRHLND